VLVQHQKLLLALKKQDLSGARDILKLHIHKLGAEERLLLKEFPDYFTSENGGNDFNVDFGGEPLPPAV
jgi:hypothetical protein